MRLYNFVCSILRFLVAILFRFEVVGRENIPNEGKYIIVCNHKSWIDPIFMMAAVKNRRIIPVAKKELFGVPVLKSLMNKLEVIPIDRSNPSMSTVKAILSQIKKERVLGIFPEGTRASRDEFLPAKPGVTLFAIKSKADVIPMSLVTRYRIFSKVRVVIGKPISMQEYRDRKVSKDEYPAIAQKMMDVVSDNYNSNKEGIL